MGGVTYGKQTMKCWSHYSHLIVSRHPSCKRKERARQHAEIQRRAMAQAAAAMAQAAAALAAHQQQMLTMEAVDGMSPSDRESFVKNFLKTEIMTASRAKQMMADGDVEEQATGSMCTMITVIRADSTGALSDTKPECSRDLKSSLRDVSGFWSHSGGADGLSQRHPHCAICLERLNINEEIGLSQNGACPHVFHKACISEWLLKHKDCPVCRRKFLDLVSM
jgi:Ring finger domain